MKLWIIAAILGTLFFIFGLLESHSKKKIIKFIASIGMCALGAFDFLIGFISFYRNDNSNDPITSAISSKAETVVIASGAPSEISYSESNEILDNTESKGPVKKDDAASKPKANTLVLKAGGQYYFSSKSNGNTAEFIAPISGTYRFELKIPDDETPGEEYDYTLSVISYLSNDYFRTVRYRDNENGLSCELIKGEKYKLLVTQENDDYSLIYDIKIFVPQLPSKITE